MVSCRMCWEYEVGRSVKMFMLNVLEDLSNFLDTQINDSIKILAL